MFLALERVASRKAKRVGNVCSVVGSEAQLSLRPCGSVKLCLKCLTPPGCPSVNRVSRTTSRGFWAVSPRATREKPKVGCFVWTQEVS